MSRLVNNPWGKTKSYSPNTPFTKSYVEYHQGQYCSGYRISSSDFELLPDNVKQYRNVFLFNKTYWFTEREALILKKYLTIFPKEILADVTDIDQKVSDMLMPGNWIYLKNLVITKYKRQLKRKKQKQKQRS